MDSVIASGKSARLSLLCLYYHQFFKKLRNQVRILATGFFWSLSWAVMAQNVIFSPHSHTIEDDPTSSPFAADSISGLFDIVFLQ